MADKFQLKALITGVDKLSPTLAGIRKNVAGFRKQMNSSGLGNIGFKDLIQGGAFAAPFIAGAKAAMEFETAMADVKKVVTFETPQQFQQMGQDVLDMSERLPMAANGIAAIVAAGGQAGFAAGELKQFAEDAVKMGIAFDQTAEQSGDMMAKWRTSFKLTQPEVVALADKINYLSNVGPSSAAQISDIVTRIGPLGAIAGLASGQIAAMGATLAGVGVPSEVAATGMKNFMLALTKGGSATKQQAQAFKSLRLDVKQVAKSMQKDAQGTIEDVLGRIAKVDPAKQAGLLTELFGTESVSAIAPLLTNLDLLKKSFAAVGTEGKFTGSMEAEFTARSKTTANAMQLLTNKVTRLGVEVGSALLPPFNDVMTLVGPLVSGLSSLAAEHPGLIKGVLGAALAYGVLRVAVTASMWAMKLFDGVTKKSIVGLVVQGIALAAGLLIANWSTVAPFFQKIWAVIEGPVLKAWDLFKSFADWGPIASIRENWDPLTDLFAATWNLLMALSTPVMDYLKTMFDWSPLGMIINNWEPITAWFKQLWEKLRPIIEPIMQWFGGGEGGEGIIQTATNKVNAFTEAQQKRNAGAGGGTGELLLADAAQSAQARQAMNNQAFGINNNQLLQQTAANNAQKLNGELNINLNGAPPGTTIERPKTNQPGLNIKPNVGTRTVGVMKG
ncbi:phage tail tape measure protein [Pseudomonas mediterranea]|uniref:Phage tail tape measure protein, TP901 family, core region n=1 Tax=Pseudomonas mediterranea TaxID=183795 RepID=A0AAX2DIM2_9PSED|nr:phage tail tape measure protein [Pseudomonas mediterranea]KGU84825.1 tail protein [Pseudomonas mediterranea CFBP 5447]SDU74629.1 phage tail tape measure protein, TP901 family, core region [Pseudomonas mediterranea]